MLKLLESRKRKKEDVYSRRGLTKQENCLTGT